MHLTTLLPQAVKLYVCSIYLVSSTKFKLWHQTEWCHRFLESFDFKKWFRKNIRKFFYFYLINWQALLSSMLFYKFVNVKTWRGLGFHTIGSLLMSTTGHFTIFHYCYLVFLLLLRDSPSMINILLRNCFGHFVYYYCDLYYMSSSGVLANRKIFHFTKYFP